VDSAINYRYGGGVAACVTVPPPFLYGNASVTTKPSLVHGQVSEDWEKTGFAKEHKGAGVLRPGGGGGERYFLRELFTSCINHAAAGGKGMGKKKRRRLAVTFRPAIFIGVNADELRNSTREERSTRLKDICVSSTMHSSLTIGMKRRSGKNPTVWTEGGLYQLSMGKERATLSGDARPS